MTGNDMLTVRSHARWSDEFMRQALSSVINRNQGLGKVKVWAAGLSGHCLGSWVLRPT